VGIKSIARNTVYLFSVSAVNFVTRFIYVVVLAHYLGPKLYGIINYGISWYLSFLSLSLLGIFAILSREIGRDKSRGAWIASLTFTLRIFTALIAAVFCGVCGWFIENNLEVRFILIVFSIGLVGRSVSLWTDAVFTAYEESRFSFKIHLLFRTLEACIGTGLLLIGGGAKSVVVVHAISWWFQALSGLRITILRLVTLRFHLSWQDLKYLLYQGIPLGLGAVSVNWLQSGPLVLFRHLGGSENSLGQLALAIQAFVIVAGVSIAAGNASLPILSRSIARQDGKVLLYVETTIRVALIFGTAVGLAGLGAGPWLVNLVFGTRYLEAGYLLGFAIWLLIPYTCGTMITRAYIARGEFFLPTVCSGLGALVMTLIMPWLIAAMNTSGEIVAVGTGMTLWALSLMCALARSGDLNVRQTIFRPLGPIFFALGVFLAMKSVNAWVAMLTSWAALLYGTLQFGGITEDEMYLLNSLKRKGYSLIGADSKRSGS
jgi:O-antigen/teichoic acid export membrane protein